MAALGSEGVILRKYLLRETSYILVVFTRQFGKIRGVMKGVRAPYPQFAGDLELFTRARILFYKKKKSPLDLITQCEATEPYLAIRKDIERLTYASYFIELIDATLADQDPNDEIYRTLVTSLGMLSAGSSPKRTARIFELKVLGALGLSPGLENCVKCGSAGLEEGRFSISSGGILCGKCAGGDKAALRVSQGTLNFMRKILKTDVEKTEHIKVSKDVGVEIEKVLNRFMIYHVNKPIRSLSFLAELQKKGCIE